MPEKCLFDYAVVRLVPRVERGEFINVGVIVSCPSRDFLKAKFRLDENRLAALGVRADLAADARKHLEAFDKICVGGHVSAPIGLLPARSRFYWLTAARSTIIQTSPVHSGFCAEPESVLERLFKTMVEPVEND